MSIQRKNCKRIDGCGNILFPLTRSKQFFNSFSNSTATLLLTVCFHFSSHFFFDWFTKSPLMRILFKKLYTFLQTDITRRIWMLEAFKLAHTHTIKDCTKVSQSTTKTQCGTLYKMSKNRAYIFLDKVLFYHSVSIRVKALSALMISSCFCAFKCPNVILGLKRSNFIDRTQEKFIFLWKMCLLWFWHFLEKGDFMKILPFPSGKKDWDSATTLS